VDIMNELSFLNWVVTSKEMQSIDKTAQEYWGLSGAVLMENAGAAIASHLIAAFDGHCFKTVVMAGTGNNGGDGFVIARHLHSRGFPVQVVIFGSRDRVQGHALTNLRILELSSVDVQVFSDHNRGGIQIALGQADVVIDALLGTGITGTVRGDVAAGIDLINEAGDAEQLGLPSTSAIKGAFSPLIVAVDIPSGIDGTSGQVWGKAVSADITFILGLAKRGLFLHPEAGHVGELVLKGISLLPEQLEATGLKGQLITARVAASSIPKRPSQGHKGTFGRVLIVGGSEGMSGAPALTAISALRTGAGLVYLGVPEGLGPVVDALALEAIGVLLEGDASGCLGLGSADEILKFLSDNTVSVLALGPGLGRGMSLSQAVPRILATVSCPIVLDADGLNAVARNQDQVAATFNSISSELIVTPHPGEMGRLLNLSAAEVDNNRIEVALSAAQDWQCIVVLKGAPTVVALANGSYFINTSGNSVLATAGSGDVLSGVICGLIAQGATPTDAAIGAVYAHGLAGDIWREEKGCRGLLAHELADTITRALNRLTQERFEV